MDEVPEPVVPAPLEVVPEPVDLVIVPPKKRGRKPKDRSLIIPRAPMKRGRKAINSDESDAAFFDIPADEQLFSKQYYSMREVTEMFKINHSQLRFWENEFAILQPKKNKKGDRLFRPQDIKNIQLIHHLIRERKYTVEGAKEYLKSDASKATDNFTLVQSLEKVKLFLLEIRAGL